MQSKKIKIETEYNLSGQYDVCVCGGGPAGVAAAIAAARRGAKTLIIESGGCLGGFWTRGMLTWFLDILNKDGLTAELLERLEAEADGRRIEYGGKFTADTEKTKLVMEKMCEQAGVTVLYHTFISGALTESNKIKAVLTQSKSGNAAYEASIFVDATGDGDFSYFAGCGYELGNDENITQPMSLICQFTGVKISDIEPYDDRISKGRKKAFLAELERIGLNPTYRSPLIAVLSEERELCALMINHEYMDGLSARNLTDGTLDARKELNETIDKLRESGGIWKNIRLIGTSEMIGVREGRRIHGLYTVTYEDVAEGRKFDDAVCTVHFYTDVHNLKQGSEKSDLKKYGRTHEPYDIPLRCLISKDMSNLLMAGRCISGDFVAHSSYRVAGNAFKTGEAAGAAAAYCIRKDISPCEITDVKSIY